MQGDRVVTAHEHSDLREFLTLLRRYILVIGVATILTGLAAFIVSAGQPKQYTSATTLLYSPTDTTGDPIRALNTIVGISTSNAVLAPVAATHRATAAELLQEVKITSDPSANLITISATSSSPQRSQSLANAVGNQLISYGAQGQKNLLAAQVASLEAQLQVFVGRTSPSDLAAASDLRTQLAQTKAQLEVAKSDLSTLSPAYLPSAPSAPHPKRNAAIGLLAGFVLGVLLATLRERLDRRVRGLDEIQALYHAPLLGTVPFLKGRRSRPMMLADFSSPGVLADAYRTVRTNLALFRPQGQGATVVLVTSATAQEGKSAIAANVAHGLSVMGKRVLAVSADLHNPSLHEYFESAPTEAALRSASPVDSNGPVGLVQVLSDEVPLSDAVRRIALTGAQRIGGGSLDLLADRRTFFDPAVLFSSAAMQNFLKLAKRQYDIVVFDTPPLLANADASLLAQEADVIVLAARLDQLTKNQARRAYAVMSAARLSPTGIIVTGSPEEPEYGYGYGYGYGSGQRDGGSSVPDQPASTGVSA